MDKNVQRTACDKNNKGGGTRNDTQSLDVGGLFPNNTFNLTPGLSLQLPTRTSSFSGVADECSNVPASTTLSAFLPDTPALWSPSALSTLPQDEPDDAAQLTFSDSPLWAPFDVCSSPFGSGLSFSLSPSDGNGIDREDDSGGPPTSQQSDRQVGLSLPSTQSSASRNVPESCKPSGRDGDGLCAWAKHLSDMPTAASSSQSNVQALCGSSDAASALAPWSAEAASGSMLSSPPFPGTNAPATKLQPPVSNDCSSSCEQPTASQSLEAITAAKQPSASSPSPASLSKSASRAAGRRRDKEADQLLLQVGLSEDSIGAMSLEELREVAKASGLSKHTISRLETIRRKVRNRRSAYSCSQRRRRHHANMKERLPELEKENEQLRFQLDQAMAKIRELTLENKTLRAATSAHSTSVRPLAHGRHVST